MSETWEYGEAAPTDTFPWPPPEDGAVLAAFGQTWKSATFDPGTFFRLVPRDRGTGAAVLFYLALGILVAGATLFWNTMAWFTDGTDGTGLASQLGMDALNPVVSFLLAPLILIFSLFLSAGVVHLLLKLFDGAQHGFGTTLRVLCYAYSPMIFGIIPVLGSIVGGVWMLVLLIIGLREAHEADGWKAVLAVLLPFVLAMGFLLFLIFVVLATGAALLA
jgi:hypothetical protein